MIVITICSMSRLGFLPLTAILFFFSEAQDREADVEIEDRERIAFTKVNFTSFRFIGGLVNDGQCLKILPLNTARPGELSAAVEVVGKFAELFLCERFIIIRSAGLQLLNRIRNGTFGDAVDFRIFLICQWAA